MWHADNMNDVGRLALMMCGFETIIFYSTSLALSLNVPYMSFWFVITLISLLADTTYLVWKFYHWITFRDRFVHPFVPVPNTLFAFVHRSISLTVPFDNPTAVKISSRIDVLDNHAFLYFVRNVVLTEPGHSTNTGGISTAVSQLLSLRLEILHLYSNYTTPVKFGTKLPRIVLSFVDGSRISTSDSIDLQGLTTMCGRMDGVGFETVPFNISLEFEDTITSLSTHTFSINATTLSKTGIYAEYTQTFTDTMTISASVGPGE